MTADDQISVYYFLLQQYQPTQGSSLLDRAATLGALDALAGVRTIGLQGVGLRPAWVQLVP